MQLIVDFFPIIAFFVAYKLTAGNIFVATGVIIVATAIQLIANYVRHKTFNRMHVVSTLLVVVFGGMTLVIKEARFIQWKPTILYWLFAIALFSSQFIGEKPLMQRMMESGIQTTRDVWIKVNVAWSVFFVLMGGINLFVVYHYDEATWVNFKLFGLLGLTLLFALLQALWLARYLPHEESESND
jgi:intracellular septation protein